MPNVLTTASKVHCAHPLAAVPSTVQTVGAPKLRVSGQPVLVKEGIAGKTITGCGTQDAPHLKQCHKVVEVTTGEASKLSVGGQKVMADQLSGTTDGMVADVTPQPGLAAEAGQTRLRAL